MPPVFRHPGAAGVLRLGGSFLLCAALAGTLLLLRQPEAALGTALGYSLHMANALFLYATLRSLVGREAPRRAALAAAASSVARLALLGAVMWLIMTRVGRSAFLGAAGGLLVAQVSLLFRRFGAEGGA